MLNSLFTPSFEQRKLQDAIQACEHADRARRNNVEELCKMLDKNPSLLKVKFNIRSPSMGLAGKNVTIYEWVLGAGTKVKNIIEPYFKKFPGGEEECESQYAKYAPLIDKLFTHPAYDCSDLLREIKAAPAHVVNALLTTPMLAKDHPAYNSDLYKAMRKFRRDWAPGELDGDKPHMHDVMKTRDEEAKEFSVLKSVREADGILDREWDNLITASKAKGDESEHDRITLVCRQVFGFMERRLTGEDRCKVAQSLHSQFAENAPLKRIDKFFYTWVHNVTNFCDTPVDSPLTASDLGGGFWVDIYYGGADTFYYRSLFNVDPQCLWNSFVEQKRQQCKAPTKQPDPALNPPGV